MKKAFLTMALLFVMGATSCQGSSTKSADTSASIPATEIQPAMEASAGVKELSQADFNRLVMDANGKFISKRPVVIDFYATWCGPCKRMAPMVEELAAEYAGKVDFYKIDVDKETPLAQQFRIEAMPTFVFIDAQGNIKMEVGSTSKDMFKANIENNCFGNEK